ncbi:hypothetical protein GCM10023213_38940 [Prosthecobacter algae]|uniref:Uncharacterized protein n=1 Tax=Prosthecobacter algae TaxID=1144682 RepID=A0ABP9PHI0_9BACT
MKLFKLIASRAGQVLFDDRVEADSPREAREQMKALMGLNSLTGVVYAITEIPVDLIQSIVDARLVEALQRLNGGQAPATVEQMLRPIASEAVREQLASLRTVQAAEAAPPPAPQRFDAFAGGAVAEQIIGQPAAVTPKPGRKRTSVTTDGTVVDWKAVKRVYRRTGSIKQTAAQFKLSINSVKARIRREGWTHE